MTLRHTNASRSPCSIRLIAAFILAVIVLAGGMLEIQGPASAQSGQQPGDSGSADSLPPRFDPERRVYDNAALLTDDQESGFEGDLERARRIGIEALVYTRISMDTADQSQAFADRIRREWSVQSADGADDGLVFLVSYDPSNLDNTSVVVSWGENTWPIRQLDESTFQGILENEMRPSLANGEADIALMYGVRRLLNYAEYSPPEPASLSATQERAHGVANVAGALLLQVAVVAYVLVPVTREHRLTLVPSPGSLAWYGILMTVLAVIVGVIGIYGRSGLGSLSALGVFVGAICIVPLLATLSGRLRGRSRVVRVVSRVRASSKLRSDRGIAPETVSVRG